MTGILERSRELPLERVPDEAQWTENYCFTANDPASRTGFWLHQSRMSFDLKVWREVMIHFRPDGTYYSSKSFGVSTNSDGPAPAAMRFAFDAEDENWNLSFRGAALHHQADEDRGGPATDGPYTAFGFEMSTEPAAPLWDLRGEIDDQAWGHEHYERMEHVSGTICIDGRTETFDGHGIRDHSRGPRDVGRIGRHSWIHGWFPSGRAFGLFAVQPSDGGAGELSAGYLSNSGGLRNASLTSSPLLDTPPDLSHGLELHLAAGGTEEIITASRTAIVPLGLVAPNEFVIGGPPDDSSLHCYESLAEFEWDGEVGWGIVEQSIRTGSRNRCLPVSP